MFFFLFQEIKLHVVIQPKLHAMIDQVHDDLLLKQFYNKYFLLLMLRYYQSLLLMELILDYVNFASKNEPDFLSEHQMKKEEICFYFIWNL